MTDSRPRPQYGEYATPEQQRLAMGLPAEPVVVPVVEPVAKVPSDAAASVSAKPRPRWDRFVTFALLGYGLFTVISSTISYANIVPLMNEAMAIVGIEGEFTNYAAGRTWGMIATVVLIAGWTLTTLLSVRRLGAGKLSWWVPVVGGVVATSIASVCLVVPLMGDPAVVDYLGRVAAGG